MRKQILAGATALLLATGMTTSAMAFSHGSGRVGGNVGSVRTGGPTAIHSYSAVHGNRFAGVRGFNGVRHGTWGGRRFVSGSWGGYGWGDPYDAYATDVAVVGLGIGLAEVATDYCDPYSYGWGYGYGYCGYGYGTPINAWSW